MEPSQDTTIFCAFSDVAARLGDKMALDDGGCRLTYAELHDEALRLAHQISAVCRQRDPVAVFLPNGARFPVAALATFAAGCPMVALDPSTPDVRNGSIVRRAGIKAIIVDDTTHEAAARLDPTLAQINFAAMGPGHMGSLPLCSPDDVAVISYTSGSTGEPKGVVHTHRNLLHHVRIRLTATDLAPSDRVALLTGTTTALATNDLLSGLLSGATLFIVDLRRNGLQELIRVLRVARITTLRTLPIIVRELTKLNRNADALASLRHVFLSSDRLFSADVDLFRRVLPAHCRLSASMGSTETQLIAHWFIDRNRPMVEPIVPVGHIQPDFQLAFVDDQDVPVAPGMVGEILVTSRYIALGYWRDEIETKRVFSSPHGDPQARTYRTGDLGRINAEGLLELSGRKDRQIKIRGNRIEPLEVEATIRTHPEVHDVAILTRHQADDLELVAYVALRQNGRLTSDNLAAWLRERLQDPMRPRHIYLIDEIPSLGNYKHDLGALAELDRRGMGTAPQNRSPPAVIREAAVSQDVAEAIRQVWARLLGDATVHENKTWEAGHGDSLKALELIFELETVLNRRISTRCIGPLTRPTDLIAKLQAGDTDGPARTPYDSVPLVFLLPGAGGYFLDLVRFAEALSSVANVQALEYAPINPRSLRIIEFNELVSDVIAPIRSAARRGEPVRVIGHSLGGFVAIEVASRLAQEGHGIECVGLIDTSTAPLRWDFGNKNRRKVPSRLASQVGEPIVARILRATMEGNLMRARPGRVFALFGEMLLRRRHFSTFGALWLLLNTFRLRTPALFLHTAAKVYLHGNAVITGARPPNFAGRVTLFRSDDPEWDRLEMPNDLGWSQFFSEISVRRVPGDHMTMIAATNVDATVKEVRDALCDTTSDHVNPALG